MEAGHLRDTVSTMRLVLRTFGSMILSSIAVSTLVLAVLSAGHWYGFRDAFVTIAISFQFVIGFSALGLFVLMPLVMLLNRRGVFFRQALLTLTIVGAVIGWLMLLLLPFVSAWLGAIAGAVTAALWVVTNRGVFQRPTRA